MSLLLLTSCEPLAGAEYRGEPIFEVQGQIVSLISPSPTETPRYRASVFWIRGPTDLREQASVSTAILLSGEFDLTFYHPPAPEHFLDESVAAGIILVYRDADLSGRFEPGETLLGGTLRQGFYYAREATTSPAGDALEPGFTWARGPLVCRDRPREPAGPVELVIGGELHPSDLSCL